MAGEPKEISVSELRAQLPEILHRILSLGERFIVTKNGQPYGILRPVDESELSEELREKLGLDPVSSH